MTLKSGKVYSDIGTPSNTYGVDGDIYMQLDGLKTTYRKEGAVWVAVGSSLGAIPEFISGSGVPSSLLGADNQYYRNVENQDIYYKGGGIWSAIGNLQGLTMSPKGLGRFKNISPSTVQYYNTFNINTITRITAGWKVTFINPLPSADYIVVGSVTDGGGYGGRSFEPYNQTTTEFSIKSTWGGDNAVGYSTEDGAEVNFAVYYNY